MNALVLLLPLLAVRYGLLALLDQSALRRAAFFPPLLGKAKVAYYAYQASTLFLFVYLFFLSVRAGGPLFYAGLTVYGLGFAVCTASVFSFARPDQDGINRGGMYRCSRNPMYIGYFLYFLGCALLTRSIPLFIALAVFQTATHWIILSEEKWCTRLFGEEYLTYKRQVRRYL